MSVVFIGYSRLVTTQYRQLRLEGIEKNLAFETEKINKTIAAIERGAVALARDGLLFVKSQSMEIAEISVLEYLYSFPSVTGSGFWLEPYAFNESTHRAGIYAFYNKQGNEVHLDNAFFIGEYDYHDMQWYRRIIDNIELPYQVVWTMPYTDDTGSFSLMTSAGAGIFVEGELIGISTIDWEIEGMIQELRAIRPTENSFILVGDTVHDFIITNTYPGFGTWTKLSQIPWDMEAHSFTYNGINFYTFSRAMDNGWILLINIPSREIFAETDVQNRSFFLGLLLLLFVMLCLMH
ncbi:MAG: cache domain-containing protein, partial [Treponema sp.]|nr:cache domain-containing protein [Treponema sp.]